jgi:hypothetical protein
MAVGEVKLIDGLSGNCRKRDHSHCVTKVCECPCHADPSIPHHAKGSPASEAAKRAWTTRRGSHAQEQAPKRPELKTGKKPPVNATAQRAIKSLFALGLWGADAGAAIAVPKAWITPDDRLTQDERTTLVNAIYLELEAHAPQVLVWLAVVVESAPTANLGLVVAVIMAPRLARHGVISESLANAITFAPLILAQQAATAVTASEQQAANVESVGTPEPDRADRNGEIDFGSASVAIPPLQVGAAEQARHGEVRHGPNDSNGTRDRQQPL